MIKANNKGGVQIKSESESVHTVLTCQRCSLAKNHEDTCTQAEAGAKTRALD